MVAKYRGIHTRNPELPFHYVRVGDKYLEISGGEGGGGRNNDGRAIRFFEMRFR